MRYDPDKHHRRSIRMRGYDYTQAGAYFITICTQDRECLFGTIVDGCMHMNDAGRMVQSVWNEIPDHHPGVDVDAFVVMPNHVHGIIILTGERAGAADDGGVGARPRACPVPRRDVHPLGKGQPRGVAPTSPPQPSGVAPTVDRGVAAAGKRMSLPDVVHRFKSLATARYRHGVYELGWPSFPGRLWQRNYYERIVRNEEALSRIRHYILDNPARWKKDIENPNTRPSPTVKESAAYYDAISGNNA